MKKIQKKWIILGVIVILLLAVILWPKDPAAAYQSVVVERGNISTYYSFSGNVLASTKDEYIANSKIEIKEYKVKTGDIVKKGDLLYIVDDSDFKSTINQAKASLSTAQNSYNSTVATIQSQIDQARSSYDLAEMNKEDALNNLNRYYKLYDLGGASLVELENMEKAYKQAQINADNAYASLKLLEETTGPININNAKNQLISAQSSYDATLKQIGDIEVYSNVDGEVTFCSSDYKISAGSTIVSVTNFDSLKASIRVDEYDINAIEIGKTANIYVSAVGDNVQGVISNLSKNANSTQGIAYFNAEVSIPNTDNILEGMSVEVQIPNKSVENVLIIPIKAISFTDRNEPYVYIKDNNKIVTQMIETGVNDGVYVEVTSGLNENQEVYYHSSFMSTMLVN